MSETRSYEASAKKCTDVLPLEAAVEVFGKYKICFGLVQVGCLGNVGSKHRL